MNVLGHSQIPVWKASAYPQSRCCKKPRDEHCPVGDTQSSVWIIKMTGKAEQSAKKTHLTYFQLYKNTSSSLWIFSVPGGFNFTVGINKLLHKFPGHCARVQLGSPPSPSSFTHLSTSDLLLSCFSTLLGRPMMRKNNASSTILIIKFTCKEKSILFNHCMIIVSEYSFCWGLRKKSCQVPPLINLRDCIVRNVPHSPLVARAHLSNIHTELLTPSLRLRIMLPRALGLLCSWKQLLSNLTNPLVKSQTLLLFWTKH